MRDDGTNYANWRKTRRRIWITQTFVSQNWNFWWKLVDGWRNKRSLEWLQVGMKGIVGSGVWTPSEGGSALISDVCEDEELRSSGGTDRFWRLEVMCVSGIFQSKMLPDCWHFSHLTESNMASSLLPWTVVDGKFSSRKWLRWGVRSLWPIYSPPKSTRNI